MSFKGLLIGIVFNILSFYCFSQKASLALADSLIGIEQYGKAISIYKSINEQFLQQKDFTNYLSTSITIGEKLDYIEQSEEAIAYLNEAVKTALEISKEDSLIALAYHKMANIHYNSFYDDNSAIVYWQKAIKLREKIFSSNHLDLIKGHRNIANALINLKKWDKAKNHCQKAIELNLSRTQIDSILLAKTYNNLGWVYTNLEDFHKAEKLLNTTLNFYKYFFVEEPWMLIDVYENLAELKRKKGTFLDVIFFQKKVLNIYDNIEDKWEEDYIKMANGYNNLGLGYEEIDSLLLAQQNYEVSLGINKNHVSKNLQALAINHNNLSRINLKRTRYQKALEYIEKAIGYDKKTKNKIGQAININDQAIILFSQRKIKLALQTVEEAINILTSSKKSIVLDELLLVNILNDKLKILKASKKENYIINDIEEIIKKIVILTNQIRTDYQSDESKSFLSKKSKPIFENAMQAILQLYEQTNDPKYITQAFNLAEQSKSIILMDALKQAQARQTTNVPSELLDKENELKHQIAAKEKALFLEEADASIVNNDLILLNQALEKLTDTLKQNYPKYHEAKYVTTLPTIKEIQNNIHGPLLEYFVGDSTIYAFKITDQANIEYVEIPLDFPLVDWIKQLREAIYKPHLQKKRSDKEKVKYDKGLVEIAYQLHQKLIAPIIEVRKNKEELIIIPDGVLGYIPFDVLITELPEEASLFGAHDYLINDFQISYAYSTASLLKMQNKEFITPAENDFVAFAPVFEGKEEDAFARSINALRSELSPLEFNIPEVKAIQQLLGGDLFAGVNATRINFIQNASNSKIVHLATHGKANDEIGDYAYLAFTEVKDAIENEFLYNRDLYNLQLNADMVVLSACETGIGELQKGEGIISLARGFSYAGAKSIITTLWSINDSKTKEIMESFYSYIKEGTTKDFALREAKLAFIDKYSHNAHPFYWAAFIPIGDMSPIVIDGCSYWKMAGLSLVFLLLSVIVFFRFKRN